MATETLPRSLESENSEALINAQLQRTRAQVKSVEFGQRILKLVVGVLVFFLLATLLDHWVVAEGLPIWARVILWLTLIGGVIWYSIKSLLPLLLYRVNPLYAARTIEETKPSLKNSLINYLTLRSEQDRLPTVIYDAIAKQAATGVNDASVEHAVDHAPLIRWGYLLLGLTFCFALYFVVSPKNPFRTVARVVVPWADLTAPSRVQIVEVTPGSVQLYRGKTVSIAARIEGLADEETATLFYTTADGQQREQPIALKLDDVRNYTTQLPVTAEKAAGVAAAPRELAGLQQDFEYYITAGDARSKTFRVQVAPAPYIGVERIEYKYPAYTKKPAETRQGEVDLQALEGTTVTIHGTANQPPKRAWIELRDSTGKPQKFPEMKITDLAASGSWTLGLKSGTVDQADFPAYALRFRNQQGDDNPEPIAYNVKVIRDEPPTIDILAPSSAEISVPWDQPIEFEVRAQDPDFALIEVKLIGTRGDKPVFSPNIASFPSANAHVGNLQKKYARSPKELGLQVGDVISYWATATDNKVPNPNIAQTTPRQFRVIEAQKRNPDNDPIAKNNPQNNPNQNPPQDKNQQQNPNQQGQPGDQQQPNQDPNQQPMGNQGQQKNDPNAQGNPQQQNDPTNLNNQNQNPQQPNGDQRQQPNQPNGQQNKQNPNDQKQDNNQKNPPQNQANDNKQQNNNGGQAGKQGNEQNKSQQGGNKSGEQQPNMGQQSKDPSQEKGDQQNNPMNGAGQNEPQQGKPGNEQQANNKSGNSQQNPQPGEQNSKQEQGGKPDPSQQAGGRPQDQNNKVNADGSQDGDAMQRLKEHFEKNQKPQDQLANNQPQPNGQQKPQDNQTGNKQNEPSQQQGNKNEAGKEPNGQQSGNKQEANKEENAKQQPNKQGGNQPGEASANKEPNQQNSGNNKSNEQNAGKQNEGQQPGANQQPANDQKNPAQQPNGQPGDQKQPNENQASQKQPGEQSPAGGQKSDPMNPQQQPGAGNQPGEQQPNKTGAGEKPEPGAKADQGAKPDANGKQPGDMKPDGNRQSPEQKQPGANAKDPNSQGSKDGNSTEPENKQNPMNNQEQSGSGNPNGSPMAQDKGKPNANPSSSNANKNDDQNKEQSPSNKGNDSASKGEEGGDRNGGGKQGGGQQENKAGRGASGSNTEDEKGGNAGKQQGDGETGTKAGNQQKSDGQTGKPGNEKGNGTEQQAGKGQQPGGQAGQKKAEGKANESGKEPGEPGGQPSAETGPPREQQGKKDGPAGNIPGGGGNSDAPAVPPQFNGPEQDTPEDKVNEAYAKKATDLVLENMKNQLRSGNLDQDLLNKLGWTKDDAQRFVDRWESLKRDAQQDGPSGNEAAAKLQERLRSLGLRPQQSSSTGDNVADDTQRGNRVNRRSAPPSEYRDIYRAFQKGASGG